MEGDIDENAALDYATFQLSSSQNRFEVSACSKGRTEKLLSGCFDDLVLQLPVIKDIGSESSDINDLLKLQPARGLIDTSWFKKATLKMFLNFVSAPEDFKKTKAIQKELNQLEDTRNFHVALYNKDKQMHAGDAASEVGYSKDGESMQRVKVETVSSDATKNELLRALELRVIVLRAEFVETLDQLLGSNCTKTRLSDLVAFVGYFGNPDLRDMLLKYSCFKFEDGKPLDENPDLIEGKKCIANMPEENPLVVSRASYASTASNVISPAKIAQAERKSPTESGESSDSSDDDQTSVERSRPVIRSASPRRSASPMRRVQIGRSGSRRAAAITIKSLGYIPAREKILINREAYDSDNEEEPSEQQSKKSEAATVRMSVQDRINLFESKQRDQTSDTQKKSLGTESHLGTMKPVLRRWSSGIGESSFQCAQGTSTDSRCDTSFNNPVLGSQKTFTEKDSDISISSAKSDDSVAPMSLTESKQTLASSMNDSLVASQSEEASDRAAVSAEWTRQKEAELNQLMKMMEIETGKFGSVMCGSGDKETSTEQKGDFYSQYRERRNEKLRTANAGKRVDKETEKNKVMQDVLEQKNVEMMKKGAPGKLNQSVQTQKPRRNSSPPVLPSKSSSIGASKRLSPKTAAPQALVKRNSLPLTPSPNSTGTFSTRTSSKINVNNTKSRKPHAATSPALPGAQLDRSRQPREAKSFVAEIKSNLKSNEEKKQKTTTKSTKMLKTKPPAPSIDDSGHMPTKPSFYNKVTKKSSVVPLEPKPFLKKGSGIGSSAGPAKSKPSQADDPSKNSEASLHAEVKTVIPDSPEKITHPIVFETVEQITDASISRDHSSDIELNIDKGEANDTPHVETFDGIIHQAESPQVEIQQEDDIGISSAAWVDSDQQSVHDFSHSDQTQTAVPGVVVSVSLSSPRVRHSLSQMLQADSTESEIVEWGNAENPPALVYQKDAPKGLKRLLKFARKSKGESNTLGWSSPSVFSDGEEDADESKTTSKKAGDALSRKTTLKTKNAGKTGNLLSESFDGGNSSKRLNDHSATHDMLSASISGLPSGIHKMRDGNGSVTNPSKGSRSFFSLSTFRSNKSADAKPR